MKDSIEWNGKLQGESEGECSLDKRRVRETLMEFKTKWNESSAAFERERKRLETEITELNEKLKQSIIEDESCVEPEINLLKEKVAELEEVITELKRRGNADDFEETREDLIKLVNDYSVEVVELNSKIKELEFQIKENGEAQAAIEEYNKMISKGGNNSEMMEYITLVEDLKKKAIETGLINAKTTSECEKSKNWYKTVLAEKTKKIEELEAKLYVSGANVEAGSGNEMIIANDKIKRLGLERDELKAMVEKMSTECKKSKVDVNNLPIIKEMLASFVNREEKLNAAVGAFNEKLDKIKETVLTNFERVVQAQDGENDVLSKEFNEMRNFYNLNLKSENLNHEQLLKNVIDIKKAVEDHGNKCERELFEIKGGFDQLQKNYIADIASCKLSHVDKVKGAYAAEIEKVKGKLSRKVGEIETLKEKQKKLGNITESFKNEKSKSDGKNIRWVESDFASIKLDSRVDEIKEELNKNRVENALKMVVDLPKTNLKPEHHLNEVFDELEINDTNFLHDMLSQPLKGTEANLLVKALLLRMVLKDEYYEVELDVNFDNNNKLFNKLVGKNSYFELVDATTRYFFDNGMRYVLDNGEAGNLSFPGMLKHNISTINNFSTYKTMYELINGISISNKRQAPAVNVARVSYNSLENMIPNYILRTKTMINKSYALSVLRTVEVTTKMLAPCIFLNSLNLPFYSLNDMVIQRFALAAACSPIISFESVQSIDEKSLAGKYREMYKKLDPKTVFKNDKETPRLLFEVVTGLGINVKQKYFDGDQFVPNDVLGFRKLAPIPGNNSFSCCEIWDVHYQNFMLVVSNTIKEDIKKFIHREKIERIENIMKKKGSVVNDYTFWIGAAPFCGAEMGDCEKIDGGFFDSVAIAKKSDEQGFGKGCWTGNKVKCRLNRQRLFEANTVLSQSSINPLTTKFEFKWFGTAPTCSVSPCDLLLERYFPIAIDNYGDGAKCVTGYKILGVKPIGENWGDFKFPNYDNLNEECVKYLNASDLERKGIIKGIINIIGNGLRIIGKK